MKIILMILLVCLLDGVYSKPMETLETDVALEDKEHKQAVLANRFWFYPFGFYNYMNYDIYDLYNTEDKPIYDYDLDHISYDTQEFVNSPHNNIFHYSFSG